MRRTGKRGLFRPLFRQRADIIRGRLKDETLFPVLEEARAKNPNLSEYDVSVVVVKHQNKKRRRRALEQQLAAERTNEQSGGLAENVLEDEPHHSFSRASSNREDSDTLEEQDIDDEGASEGDLLQDGIDGSQRSPASMSSDEGNKDIDSPSSDADIHRSSEPLDNFSHGQ